MQKRVFTVWNEFSLNWLCVARLTRLLLQSKNCIVLSLSCNDDSTITLERVKLALNWNFCHLFLRRVFMMLYW